MSPQREAAEPAQESPGVAVLARRAASPSAFGVGGERQWASCLGRRGVIPYTLLQEKNAISNETEGARCYNFTPRCSP